VSRSRLVPLALAVTVLLAVVAVAARGRPLGSGGGGRGGLPVSFWDYTYTTIVILVVPALFAGLFAASLMRRKVRKPRSFMQSLLLTVGLYLAIVVVEVFVIRHLEHLHLHAPGPRQSPPGNANVGNLPGIHGHHHGNAGTKPLRFRWDELVVILVLLLGAVGVAVWLFRRDSRRPREAAPEVLAAALDESLDDLRRDPDLRRAIIAAYARMEAALAAAGIPRHPAEAPLEYVERALLSLDTSADAVRTLTDLFEWARFSHHEPEPSMRDDAVDALEAVRDELRAPEPELTPA
jgi:hypothetical protein